MATAAQISVREALHGARNWGYQLDGPDPAEIAGSQCELIVMDYSRDGHEDGAFSPDELATIREGAGERRRVVVSYLSIGEAEDYRFYWKNEWEDPASRPPWLAEENPEWRGNYQVRYWDPAWQEIVLGSRESYIERIIRGGFDGIFIDRVDAYAYWEDGRDSAADEMVDLVKAIAAHARRKNEDFVVIVQNGEQLLEHPDYVAAIDGVAKEDLFYGAEGRDIRNSETETEDSLKNLAIAQAAGLPVFLVEYTNDPEKIREISTRARRLGLIATFAERALANTPDCRHSP